MDRIRKVYLKKALLPLFAAALVFMAGCVEETRRSDVKDSAPQSAQSKQDEGVSIEAINVVGMGDAVLIEANGPVKYTSFKLSDPPRVVVDFPGAGIRTVEGQIAVNNSYITAITASTYGEGDKAIARVEIGLQSGIGSDLKAGDDSILVDLRKETYVPGASAPAPQPKEETSPVALEAAPAIAEPEPVAAPDKEEPVKAAPPLPPAKKLVLVEFTEDTGATIARISADGAVGAYNSFGLDSPSRVVVDIPGIDASTLKKEFSVPGAMVKRLRVGSYPDKARLVFDSPLKAVPPYFVDRDGSTLIVRFGTPPTADSAVKKPYVPPQEPASTTPVAAAAPAHTPAAVKDQPSGPASVNNVDFKRMKDKARLSIESSAPVKYSVKESGDGMSITIDVLNAVIPAELRLKRDAADLKTPVATISSYQVSEEPEAKARVLVKLSSKAAYIVSDSNGSIYMDFQMAQKAASAEEKKPVEAEGSAAVPPAAGAAPAKPAESADGKSGPKYTGQPIDIEMFDADVRDLIKLIGDISNKNMVASDDVTGKMTLRLKDVPWDQVLDIILVTKGLGKIETGNVVRIVPAAKMKQENEAAIQAQAIEEKLEDLETEYIRVNYDKAADLQGQLDKIKSDRGSINVHAPTNTIIVKDTKKSITGIKEYISKIDIPIPQVLIEARIVEAESSFARDLGIQWGVDVRGGGPRSHTGIFGSHDDMGQAAPQPNQQDAEYTGGGVASQDKNAFLADVGATNYAVSLPAAGKAGTLGALGLILGIAGNNPAIIDLRLSAGETDGLVKTISRPRIVTLDNKEAKIEQGESIPFSTTSAGGTQTSFIDANLSLTVTPHITPDGSVQMKIKASRNSIGSFTTSSGQPSINKKEASTEVLVKDGETTVLGGIVISDTSRSERGIPFLKNIPGIGWLFKAKSISDTQRELLIFITPSVVKDGSGI